MDTITLKEQKVILLDALNDLRSNKKWSPNNNFKNVFFFDLQYWGQIFMRLPVCESLKSK